jgi:hypothetical protein
MKVPKTYLNKFSIIEDECTAVVQAASTVDDRYLIKGENERYLIPLRALDINKQEELLEVLASVEGPVIDIELLYPFMLTGVLWRDKVTQKLDLPVKGENLIATFEYSDLDELKCSGIITINKVRPKKFNLINTQFNNV